MFRTFFSVPFCEIKRLIQTRISLGKVRSQQDINMSVAILITPRNHRNLLRVSQLTFSPRNPHQHTTIFKDQTIRIFLSRYLSNWAVFFKVFLPTYCMGQEKIQDTSYRGGVIRNKKIGKRKKPMRNWLFGVFLVIKIPLQFDPKKGFQKLEKINKIVEMSGHMSKKFHWKVTEIS